MKLQNQMKIGLTSVIILCCQIAFGLGLTKPELEKYIDNKVKLICVYDDSKSYNSGIKYRVEILQESSTYFMNYKDDRSLGNFVVNIYNSITNEKLNEFEADGMRHLTDYFMFQDTTQMLDFRINIQGLPEGFGRMNFNGKNVGMKCVAEVVPESVVTSNASDCNVDTDSDCIALDAAVN